MTLKSKLLIFVTLVILVVTTLLTTSAYLQLRSNLESSTIDKLLLTNTQTANRIGEWLASKKMAIEALGKAKPADGSLIESLAIVSNSAGFSSTYVGFDDGRILFSDGYVPDAGYDPRKRPWYELAEKNGAISVTSPYIDASTKELVITVAMPGSDNKDEHKGVYSGDIFITDIVNTVLSINLGKNGAALLVDGDGMVIAYKDESAVMQPFSKVISGLNSSSLVSLSTQQALSESTVDGQTRLTKVTQIPGNDWYLLSLVDPQEAFAALNGLLVRSIIMSLIIFAVFMSLAVLGLHRLLRPLGDVSAALNDVAKGEGDLTRRLSIGSKDELGKIAESFNAFIDHIQPIMVRVANAADTLTDEANIGRKNAGATAEEVEKQLREVTQAAAAMHEMSAAAHEVAQHAEDTAAASRQSAEACNQGLKLVTHNRNSIARLASEIKNSTEVIHELNRHSKGISTILETIQSIAEQTNLLALNAAIEAARAGDHGRGFAVVADEVRVLSQRTHSSTEEIQNMIEQLQSTTSSAVQSMEISEKLATDSVDNAEKASASLEEINASIHHISDRAIQIASAAEEQKAVSDDISRNTESIQTGADALAIATSESLERAESLKAVANLLHAEMSKFKLQ